MPIEILTKQNFPAACDRLAASDAALRAMLRAHGYPPLWSRPNTFQTLVHIILEQQVSLASAKAALVKLKAHLKARTGSTRVEPAALLALSDVELRACYFSRQKAGYARALAQTLVAGALDLKKLKALPDDAVRAQLIALKGIGHWTIDIYLMFVLHRPDVFPLGDLAAVNTLRRMKHLPPDTPRETLLAHTAAWSPLRTAATMILWHEYLSKPRPRSA